MRWLNFWALGVPFEALVSRKILLYGNRTASALLEKASESSRGVWRLLHSFLLLDCEFYKDCLCA